MSMQTPSKETLAKARRTKTKVEGTDSFPTIFV